MLKHYQEKQEKDGSLELTNEMKYPSKESFSTLNVIYDLKLPIN